MRIALIAAIVVGVAASASSLAAAQSRSDPLYPPTTAAERSQTLPLVKLVLTAHKSGDASALCGIYSLAVVQREFGSRARCRAEIRKFPLHPCKTCSYRIWKAFGVYRTASDRRQKRKTISWLVVVKGD